MRAHLSSIDRLFGQFQAAHDSALQHGPACRGDFALEEPIAWVRLHGLDVRRYYKDPAYYLEQALRQKIWKLTSFPSTAQPNDFRIPFSLGFYPEFTFVGIEVEYDALGIPRFRVRHAVRETPNLDLLRPISFQSSGIMPRAFEFHAQLQDLVAGRAPVPFQVSWWRGCLDLAIELRGYEAFMDDVRERPEFVHGLLRWLTGERCNWHRSYCKHFGVSLGPADIGDDWLNVPFISPGIFRDYVLPQYLLSEAFHGSIRHVHSCGNQTPLQRDMLKLATLQTFEVSPWSDLGQSIENLPPDKHLVISVHPNLVLCCARAEIRRRLEHIRERCAQRSYSVSTSGLTPLGEEREFVERIKVWLQLAEAICPNQTRGYP